MKAVIGIIVVGIVIAYATLGSSKKVKVLSLVGDVVINAESEAFPAAEKLAFKKHTFVYFSAHWCPPCRTFTPILKRFYEENGGGEEFEILFVSSDRDEESMMHYMEEAEMPWLAIPFDNIPASNIKNVLGGKGIPNLVLLDKQGNVLSGSYDGSKYLGPQTALNAYTDLDR